MDRTAFEYAEYGYGSTSAVILAQLCMGFTLAVFRASSKRTED